MSKYLKPLKDEIPPETFAVLKKLHSESRKVLDSDEKKMRDLVFYSTMKDFGIVDVPNLITLDTFCNNYLRNKVYLARLKKTGPVVINMNGVEMSHPLCSITMTMQKQMQAMLRDLGVTKAQQNVARQRERAIISRQNMQTEPTIDITKLFDIKQINNE